MPRVFGVPNTLAPEFHPHSLQPGARVVEGFEIPENRIQTEPCNEGVRIVSLDGGFRPHLAIDGDRK